MTSPFHGDRQDASLRSRVAPSPGLITRAFLTGRQFGLVRVGAVGRRQAIVTSSWVARENTT